MDRTAWIVIAFCVVGLLLWEFYFAKEMAPRPAPVTGASGQASPTTTPAVLVPSPSPLATPEVAAQELETVPTFPEKGETLSAIANAPFLDTAGKVEALYFAALSRQPTPDESGRLVAYVNKAAAASDKKKALSDVFWALLNSTEFLFNH